MEVNMKRLFLIIVPALICWAAFTSCGKDEAQVTEDGNKILHGKWQLISISPLNVEGMNLALVGYSPNNIIYEFKANNVLTVSGNIENINYGGLEIGEYFYDVALAEIIVDPLSLPTPHVVRINTIPYDFSFDYMSDSPGMVMVCRDGCDHALSFEKNKESVEGLVGNQLYFYFFFK